MIVNTIDFRHESTPTKISDTDIDEQSSMNVLRLRKKFTSL
jgi:hypothetical protein